MFATWENDIAMITVLNQEKSSMQKCFHASKIMEKISGHCYWMKKRKILMDLNHLPI
ncbi:hypothetical protein SDC9_193335 [bioreactor metagenome]|uniref:Uncharacterized protein n=1 Tax=bioreactor metagenome TaxID=1076179 RepID=A0A645IBT7_9ZZZZ